MYDFLNMGTSGNWCKLMLKLCSSCILVEQSVQTVNVLDKLIDRIKKRHKENTSSNFNNSSMLGRNCFDNLYTSVVFVELTKTFTLWYFLAVQLRRNLGPFLLCQA